MSDRAKSLWILAAGLLVRLVVAYLLLGALRAMVGTMGVDESAGPYAPDNDSVAENSGVGPFAPILVLFGLVGLAAASGALVALVQQKIMSVRPPAWVGSTATAAIGACSAMVCVAMVVLLFVPQEIRWTTIVVFFYAEVLAEGLAILRRQRHLLAA
jgi:hypothetical protein